MKSPGCVLPFELTPPSLLESKPKGKASGKAREAAASGTGENREATEAAEQNNEERALGAMTSSEISPPGTRPRAPARRTTKQRAKTSAQSWRIRTAADEPPAESQKASGRPATRCRQLSRPIRQAAEAHSPCIARVTRVVRGSRQRSGVSSRSRR